MLRISAVTLLLVTVGGVNSGCARARATDILVIARQYRAGDTGLYVLKEPGNLVLLVPGAEYAQYSPDHRYIAYVRGGNLWVYDATTGRQRPSNGHGHLCSGPDDIAWTRDSRWVCYPYPSSQMAEMLLRGLMMEEAVRFGKMTTLAETGREVQVPSDDAGCPTFSPSGRLAYCARAALAGVGVVQSHVWYGIDNGNSSFQRATKYGSGKLELSPRWASSGDIVGYDVVDLDSMERRTELLTVSSGETARLKISWPPKIPEGWRNTWLCGWRPLHSEVLVAFGPPASGALQQRGLAIVNNGIAQIIELGEFGSVESACWSPDGARVAYILRESVLPAGHTDRPEILIQVFDVASGSKRVVYRIPAEDAPLDPEHQDPVAPLRLEW